MGKEQEYKEIFLAEALESHEQLNNLFTQLEKDIKNKSAIDAIFRITHTLKGNAMGMGFTEIAELSHVMEDLFNEVKSGRLYLDAILFESLFKANDILGELINAVNTGEKIKYIGLKTKLEVILRKSKAEINIEQTKVENSSALNESKVEVAVIESVATAEMENTIPSEEIVTAEEPEIELEQKISISDTVQVPVRKLDALLNIVGELIIEKDALIARNIERGYKASDLARLHRITSDLQYGIMDVRLVQIGFLFNKFNRVIRDVAVLENKKVNLVLEGTENEIDRNILKIMSDSMVHLVRNSVSHGIESPEVRIAKGKPEIGIVTLRARNEKDTVFIDVIDDGNGIDVNIIKKKAIEKGIMSKEHANLMSDEEIMLCIFEPGFSNAEKVTEVSGRGVGMDVVRKATESIGGRVNISTQVGKGSTFTLSLPSSMAVKGALLFEMGKQEYAIALSSTEAVISLRKKDIHKVSNGLMSKYLGQTISLVFLKDLFGVNGMIESTEEGAFHHSFDALDERDKIEVVIVSHGKKLVGIVVDKLIQQKEIVEKTLSKPLNTVELISGATILGNGNVCLVLDVVKILSSFFKDRAAIRI